MRTSSLAIWRYFVEPRTRQYVKRYRFLSGEFIGNKTTDAVPKSCDNKIVKQEPVEEIIILQE